MSVSERKFQTSIMIREDFTGISQVTVRSKELANLTYETIWLILGRISL